MRTTLASLLCLSGLLLSPLSALAAVTDSISIENGFVREVPPGQPNSAAFMTIKNSDFADHKVVNARSPVANVVELHTHTHEGGMMKMRQIPDIGLPAGGESVLKPGGLHVMLIDLKQPLKSGDMIPVELEFEDGSRKALSLPVQPVTPMGRMMQH